MVQHMHLFGIEKQPAVDIPNKGVVGKGIPEPGDNIVKFPRAAIALGMIRLFLAAEVPGRVGI